MRLDLVRVVAVLLAVAATSLAVRAQETLETVSGQTYHGTIDSSDATSVKVTTTDGMTLSLPLASLTPPSQYRVKSLAAQDGQSQLALAEWCVTETLYPQAKTCFRKALELDPLLADEIKTRLAAARDTAADELLARAKALQAAGRPQDARKLLSTMVQELPLETATQEATRMLADEATARKDTALARPRAKSGERSAAGGAAGGATAGAVRSDGEPFSDATRELFQPIVDSYHKMLDATLAGLSKSGNAGTKEYEAAIREGEKIRKAAEKLRSRADSDAEIAEALALVDAKLEEALVDARVNLANDYMLRTSYNDASKVVSEGLAEYPKNERLLATRSEVVAATASNGGGGWVVGGRGR